MMKRLGKISVIIPVYNVEEYLPKTLDSILSQAYSDIEVLLIDDGSTDNSVKICEAYAAKDDRVIVYCQANAGPSRARNNGLDHATGAYILFVDSDDLLSKNALELLVSNMATCSADIAFYGSEDFYDVYSETDLTNPDVYTLDRVDALKRMFMHEGFGHAPWGKLYKKELWNEIRFPEDIMCGEDYAVLYKVVNRVKKAIYMPDVKYMYRQREGSIMNGTISPKKMKAMDVALAVTEDVEKNIPEVYTEALRQSVVTHIKVLSEILESDDTMYIDEQRRIVRYVKKHAMKLICSGVVAPKDLIKIIALKFFGKLGVKLIYQMKR